MTNIETKRRTRRWTAIIFIVVVQIFLSYASKTVAVNAFVTKTIATSTLTSTLLHPKSTLLHPKSASSSVAGLTILPSLPQSYTSTSTVGRTSYTKGTTTTARQQSKQSTMILLQHPYQLHQLQKRRLGVGLFSTTAADAENENETELPLPSAAVVTIEEEEQSHDNNDRKKKKIELMIDKIERKYLSSSRLLRLLFYPLRLLIWKPLRMLMEIFIDRSDKDGNMNVDNTSASTSSSSSSSSSSVVDVEDKIAVVTTSDTDTIDTSSSSVAEVKDNIPVVTTSDTDIIDATSVPTASTTSSSSDDVGADVGADVVVTCPIGDRWAISAPGIDLSGKWELIITKEFKKEYDIYLGRLGQPKLVRSVALSAPVIGKTFEELIQTDSGRSLFIHGVNIRGTWDRTLVTSGTSLTDKEFIPLQVPITTVDSEPVEAESWWEDQGRVHMSYLRGVTMYGGGSFVSRRYYEEKNEDEDVVYACESSFVFNDTKKEPNSLTWRFHRQKRMNEDEVI